MLLLLYKYFTLSLLILLPINYVITSSTGFSDNSHQQNNHNMHYTGKHLHLKPLKIHTIAFTHDEDTEVCLEHCPKNNKTNAKSVFFTSKFRRMQKLVFNKYCQPPKGRKSGFYAKTYSKNINSQSNYMSLMVEENSDRQGHLKKIELKIDNLISFGNDTNNSGVFQFFKRTRSAMKHKLRLALFFNEFKSKVTFKYSDNIHLKTILLNSVDTLLRLGDMKLENLILFQNAINGFSMKNLSDDSRYPGVENLHFVLSEYFKLMEMDLDGDADDIENIIIHNNLISTDYISPYATIEDSLDDYDDEDDDEFYDHPGKANYFDQSLQAIVSRSISDRNSYYNYDFDSYNNDVTEDSYREAMGDPTIVVKILDISRMRFECAKDRRGNRITELIQIIVELSVESYDSLMLSTKFEDLECFEFRTNDRIESELDRLGEMDEPKISILRGFD